MNKWQCTVCGYIHTGDSPPEKCPVCGADQSLFVPFHDEVEVPSAASAPGAGEAVPTANRWRCSVCGYIHSGSQPPEKCPVCGADRSLFIPESDDAPPAAQSTGDSYAAAAEEETPKATAPPSGRRFPWGDNPRLTHIADTLTRLHGHPIAVHIPNGVLPVTVIFCLLALLFRSESFALAAAYNMLFVCLAMPVVIATGLIDWINRFGGHMTPIFKNKLICAGIVSLLSLVLAIWWLAAPDIYQGGLFANWFFVLLHLADLAVAGLAGWFGGKLVFQA